MTLLSAGPAVAVVRGHDVPLDLYVNGEWRPTADRFPVRNPSTDEVIAEVAAGSADDGRGALDSAVAAQASWRDWAPRRRADLFHAAYRLLVERTDAFADVMTAESGKPRAESLGEFALSAGFWLWYAEQIAHLHGTYAHGSPGGYRIITGHEPVGPSLLITPWNFPMLMSARKAGAALGAGCTVVMKSAQETPLTAALFVQTLHDAGFPPGSVNLVHTRTSAAVADALLSDFRLRKVSFTGSTAVGSTLLGKAATNVANTSMELGGDGPFIVLDDADVDLAVEQAVVCKFRNAGQACVAANRIILQSAVADEFTEKFLDRVSHLEVGDGFDPSVDVGPLINVRQRERVVALPRDLRRRRCRGARGRSAHRGPRLLLPNRRCCACRTRARTSATRRCSPRLPLSTPSTQSRTLSPSPTTPPTASRRMCSRATCLGPSRSRRGSPSAWSASIAGSWPIPPPPFGGTKASGIGREGGHDGIYEFLERKYIALTIDTDAALSHDTNTIGLGVLRQPAMVYYGPGPARAHPAGRRVRRPARARVHRRADGDDSGVRRGRQRAEDEGLAVQVYRGVEPDLPAREPAPLMSSMNGERPDVLLGLRRWQRDGLREGRGPAHRLRRRRPRPLRREPRARARASRSCACPRPAGPAPRRRAPQSCTTTSGA
jgi:succinate-semialdehyde dehydrogenase/glutarate-semialdehyde dehydrogenase